MIWDVTSSSGVGGGWTIASTVQSQCHIYQEALEHFIGPSEDTEFFLHSAKTTTRLFADHTVLMLPDNSTDLNPTETLLSKIRWEMSNAKL